MKIREFYANEATIQGFANSGVTPKTTQLIINTLQGRKRENVKLFLLISYNLYSNFDKHTLLIINPKTIIIMKRFFIFAAMLLTLTVYAGTLNEDPPLIKPAAEQIVLIPKGMYDIDRSIATCRYTLLQETIEISCSGTGSTTELYLTDSKGCVLQYATVDPEIIPVVTFDKPEISGTYYLVLDSGRYYGEGMIMIE